MKKKGIILLSHCILNRFSKIETSNPKNPDISKLVSFLVENNIGMIQLACPENHMYGIKRWGHVRDQFDTPFFREKSSDLLKPVLMELKDYRKNDFVFLGVVGIDGSPSCGVNISCASPRWGGEFKDRGLVEEKLSSLDYGQTKGIYMEVLEGMLEEFQLGSNFFGLVGEDIDKLVKEIDLYLQSVGYK